MFFASVNHNTMTTKFENKEQTQWMEINQSQPTDVTI